MASTKAECADLSADTKNTSTGTYTQFENLSADVESTNTGMDAQFENVHAEDAYNMDTLDTLTLARVDRENQGPWEAEYSYEGEAGLHANYKTCTKNPGHMNFIPVDKFSIKDLPEDYRSQDMVDYIRAISDLTVRVTVNYISDRRPATVPWSGKRYLWYSERGTQRRTFGTGKIFEVNLFDDSEEQEGICECKDCKNSSTPEKQFAIINIQTATHVVYDELEAEHTTFHLFYDRGNTPGTCQGVVTLTGGLNAYSSINGDKSFFKFFTHDLDLAYRLQNGLVKINNLECKISITRHSFNKHKQTLNVEEKQPLLFIVSHPHGCSKQISLGRFISAHLYNNKVMSYQYTTPSCPGSSGAAVLLPAMSLEPTIESTLFEVHESHCGVSVDDPEINFCPTDKQTRVPQPVSLNLLKFDKGLWEDYFSCEGEEDLHKHYETCQKNPGHQNFFPVDKFSMDNLPPVYRTNDMFDFIKIVSDLTVRLSVKYVSEERPATVPGTDIPYPWYSHRGGNQLRKGNGWITHIVIYNILNPKSGLEFPETCFCQECQSSLSPKTNFAHIYIQSALHLVYDRMEAEHTRCQLVLDSRVVTFTDICDFYDTFHKDTCQLAYVSHDMDLAYRINNLLEKYMWRYSSKAHNFFKLEDHNEQNTIRHLKKESPLYVVVSHPHGCAKHISIGYCSNHDNTDTEDQIPYASIICPGSSGAPLITLGWETFFPEIVQSSIKFE